MITMMEHCKVKEQGAWHCIRRVVMVGLSTVLALRRAVPAEARDGAIELDHCTSTRGVARPLAGAHVMGTCQCQTNTDTVAPWRSVNPEKGCRRLRKCRWLPQTDRQINSQSTISLTPGAFSLFKTHLSSSSNSLPPTSPFPLPFSCPTCQGTLAVLHACLPTHSPSTRIIINLPIANVV